ncbi:MAG: four helix bundle protein [Bacteroidaceae bacterium]|nr:four helix bundle protein [Bacteroidaceae bacterium]
MKGSIVADKSKAFALQIIRLYRSLTEGNVREYVISKQLLRSGTSIGANIREAHRGQSRADFVSKMNISLKEACESEYWIELLYESGYIEEKEALSIQSECKELIKLLTAIVKTTSTSPTQHNCEL